METGNAYEQSTHVSCKVLQKKTSNNVLFYFPQFRTPNVAMETLFSILNGDEIFATLAILEEDNSGGDWIFWFSRVYITVYVAVFTIVVINLLIGIFMSTYESIKVSFKSCVVLHWLQPGPCYILCSFIITVSTDCANLVIY